jgi:hypothetical protein
MAPPTRALFLLAAVLRVVSRIACLIVLVSFVIFAVEQTGSASDHQQDVVNEASATATAPAHKHTASAHKGAVHKAIDGVADTLTSPFSGVTSGTNSQWAVNGVDTVMALLVYGLGLGYLARVLRVRV